MRPATQTEFGETTDQYKVKLEMFEGPLDLLLYLIRKEEVSIYDIPIARITEQYLDYLRAMKELDIGVAGEFLGDGRDVDSHQDTDALAA